MTGLAYLDGGEADSIDDIKTLFRRATKENPDSEAVVSLHQNPIELPGIQQQDGETRLAWTFKQLGDGSDNLAQRLAALGMCRGTSIMIFSDNCAEWALFLWAAVRLGCPFVPMNPSIIMNVDELRHILQVVCPGTVIVQDENAARALDENAPNEMLSTFLRVTLSPLKDSYFLEEQFPEHYTHQSQMGEHKDKARSEGMIDKDTTGKIIGWVHLPSLWPKKPELIPFPKQTTKASFDDTITIGFTSGTTSFPKACPQSSENFKIVCAIARGSGLRVCQHGPPYHGIACFVSLSYWSNGGAVVYPSAKFEVTASLDAVESERCTTMVAVPAMIKAFTMVPNISKRRLGSLSSVSLSGAPVFPETIQLCRDILGIKVISVNWGMSENPAPLLFLVTEETELPKDRFFPVGKPAPGMKVKVCAPDSRIPISRGVEGELHAGGPQVIPGYLNAGNDMFYEDEEGRWIITGDMASMDDDGNVFILGRYKDIIIRGGVNIAPANVERKLNSVPGVDVSLTLLL
jgi:acyl-CoA synthetase (AMP-forming)/AMP-acid ligase II